MSDTIFQAATTLSMAGLVIAVLGTDIFSQTQVAGYAFILLVVGAAGVGYSMLTDTKDNRRSMAEPTEVSVDE